MRGDSGDELKVVHPLQLFGLFLIEGKMLQRKERIAAVQIALYDLLDDRTEEAVLLLEAALILSRSRIAEAVTESKIFPRCEGMRLVVTMVVRTSVLLEMIWKNASACSLFGTT
jgi:hypothetical protein